MLLPLPTTIASCLPSIQWPLGPGSSPPMMYEPLDALKNRRSASTSSSSSSSTSPIDGVLSDVAGTVASLTPNGAKANQQQNAALSVAIVLLGHGYTDECHDLVTPLSWGDDTPFGGTSLRSSASASVISSASYVHSLVHRREAHNVGEYGMMGYSNANYWSNAAHSSSGAGTLPYGEMRRAILEASEQFGQEARDWCHERIVEEGGDDAEYWESRALHELCAQVSQGSSDADLRAFAEAACEVELRVLLRHCLEGAGYECPDCIDRRAKAKHNTSVEIVNPKSAIIDESAALRAGGKVSSAHLNTFQSNGSIVIRNVLVPEPDGVISQEAAASASVGIAARLLDTPAVCATSMTSADTDDDDVLCILLPLNENDARENSDLIGSAVGGGGSLNAGDVFATTGNLAVQASICACRKYMACPIDNSAAVFVDSLHGSKGETPTTVIQWSKGTVHYKSQ